jgi:hypothetical protein
MVVGRLGFPEDTTVFFLPVERANLNSLRKAGETVK